jgi:hypothetical protein
MKKKIEFSNYKDSNTKYKKNINVYNFVNPFKILLFYTTALVLQEGLHLKMGVCSFFLRY